jgi:hypothetical protein
VLRRRGVFATSATGGKHRLPCEQTGCCWRENDQGHSSGSKHTRYRTCTGTRVCMGVVPERNTAEADSAQFCSGKVCYARAGAPTGQGHWLCVSLPLIHPQASHPPHEGGACAFSGMHPCA